MSTVRAPWLKSYGDVPATLNYPEGTMKDALESAAWQYPDYTAYEFMGKRTSYEEAMQEIGACARALRAIGIRENDRVTICLPNCPQAVTMFYAVNMVGAVANMVHPLSSEGEIRFYLEDSGSVAAITLDQFHDKFQSARKGTKLKHLIIASVKDALSPVMKLGYAVTQGRKIPSVPKDADALLWKDFLKRGHAFKGDPTVRRAAKDPAVILYSGGTTGTTKGILLTNLNFNALGAQLVSSNKCFTSGVIMLSIMPMFHGFGLGVGVHTMLINGAQCILVPRFTPDSIAGLIKKYRPNFMAGVPTLYEAILRSPASRDLDMSCFKGIFSGGDSLSVELKKRFDKFLREHNGTIEIREGYGTTECVTASCVTPEFSSREGSIGIPLPDMYYKVVRVGTEDELPYGEEGEICLAGPTVMVEYVNQPKETADTLKRHADGMTWVHTGDLGFMDEDGFLYFRQRIKRMIVTSGYNVYPSQVENILDANEYVHMSCVIGVPDPLKVQKVKAFVMLKPGVIPSDKVRNEIYEYCTKHIARYAMPYDIEFRQILPKTLVGKVAYRELEQEELQKTVSM
ncbi:MAG: AMP-binding protein [Clostridiaceae bacterium]|nr:AMP-binding protein [Eubacteriales bacterium]